MSDQLELIENEINRAIREYESFLNERDLEKPDAKQIDDAKLNSILTGL